MRRKTFDEVVADAEHQDEIRASRIGGFGGSDADMFLRIGRKGIEALTATDNKRIAVMLGHIEPVNFGGNSYTNAGHLFEDWVAAHVLHTDLHPEIEREKKLCKELTHAFKTFTHADFVTEGGGVIECKYTQDDTATTAKRYAAQLQWYYLLGAPQVVLLHGEGDVEPFRVNNYEVTSIAPDMEIQTAILRGVEIIAEYIREYKAEDTPITTTVDELGADVALLIAEYMAQKARVEAEQAKADALGAELLQMMRGYNIATITGADFTLSYSQGATRRSFDAARFVKEHPEFNTDEWFKTSTSKASVSLRSKKNYESKEN